MSIHALGVHASISGASGRIHLIVRHLGDHLRWSRRMTHWDDTTSSCDSLVSR
jgi:hypothetical protein